MKTKSQLKKKIILQIGIKIIIGIILLTAFYTYASA